jgi:ABC-type dipeptide/oligopeptide/nickel transport system ATPase component
MGEIPALAEARQIVLQVHDLTVDFGGARGGRSTRALDHVSFTVSEGQSVGIVGESGSGKSVLVRSLLLLLGQDARITGEILYQGNNLLQMSPPEVKKLRGKGIAHILPGAKEQLNPVLRVEHVMTDVIRVHDHIGKREALSRALVALKSLGIPDPQRCLKAFPHELSGGMAQRVCIALALVHEPRLIIADEPTAGLDVTVQREVLDLMSASFKRRQAAQLIVTRDLGIIAQYCDGVAVMRGGQIVEYAPTLELFDSPKHPYSRSLLAAVRRRPANEALTAAGGGDL